MIRRRTTVPRKFIYEVISKVGPGTWNVPLNVSDFGFFICGGGGDGGEAYGDVQADAVEMKSGAGGSGGGYWSESRVNNILPGSTVTYDIGARGQGSMIHYWTGGESTINVGGGTKGGAWNGAMTVSYFRYYDESDPDFGGYWERAYSDFPNDGQDGVLAWRNTWYSKNKFCAQGGAGGITENYGGMNISESQGGQTGGGNGGFFENGQNATFYGGGGGGAFIETAGMKSSPGLGYQGVLILRYRLL